MSLGFWTEKPEGAPEKKHPGKRVTREEAYERGQKDHASGKSLNAVPYRDPTAASFWELGWKYGNSTAGVIQRGTGSNYYCGALLREPGEDDV